MGSEKNRRQFLAHIMQYPIIGYGVGRILQLLGYRICYYSGRIPSFIAWVEDKYGNCVGFITDSLKFMGH